MRPPEVVQRNSNTATAQISADSGKFSSASNVFASLSSTFAMATVISSASSTKLISLETSRRGISCVRTKKNKIKKKTADQYSQTISRRGLLSSMKDQFQHITTSSKPGSESDPCQSFFSSRALFNVFLA